MTQIAQPTIYQRIWEQEVPSYPIYRNEAHGLMAILDIHPATPGHALVIPAEPAERWTDLSPERLRQVTFLSQLVAKRQISVLGANSVVNAYFGDDVPHVHSHNIPSYQRSDVITRMQPSSGRMKETIDGEALASMRDKLAFPDALREYADLELGLLGEKSRFMYLAKSCLLFAQRRHKRRQAFA